MGLRENGGGRDAIASMAPSFIYSYAHAKTSRVSTWPCNRLKLRDVFSGNSEMLSFNV